MKKIISILSLLLCICLLSSCMGTPVVYHDNCDCPTEEATGVGTQDNTQNLPLPEGALKTGLSIVTSIKDSTSASEDKNGEGKYDVTIVAVTVDDSGIIHDCIIDGVAATVKFDNTGKITTDLTSAPKTKNELGADYGMVAHGGAIAEWNEQAQALADFAVGKTVDELKNGAIDETGKAPQGSELASSATIYLGGYVSAIEKAVLNAKHLGANSTDKLCIAANSLVNGSKDAGEKAGLSQLDTTVVALTLNNDVISSCYIDSVQAKVEFDNTGIIVTDINNEIATKNELGADYGMVAHGGAIAEWNEQAASFAKYVTGKTAAEVSGIAVNERTAPTDTDLASSVTIAIGDFIALINEATK